MKKIFFLFSLLYFSCNSPNDPLKYILDTNQDQLGLVVNHPEDYELQIIYTQINRDQENNPSFKSFYFNVDSSRYFYPASTIKMPTAIMALEKLNDLRIPSLNKHTPLMVDSIRNPQTILVSDSTAETGIPSIAHFVKKIFLVSDNDAHNRLYEFVGQEYLNQKLNEKGYTGTKIIHRIGPSGFPFNVEDNRYTNPFLFYYDDDTIHYQPEVFNKNPISLPSMKLLQKGKGYIQDGNKVNEPKDFSQKNRFSILDMEKMMRAIMFPDHVNAKNTFNLKPEDYRFIYRAMSMRPRESDYPKYGEDIYDSYVKFFIFGDQKSPMPDAIRIFNKVGWAYGYLSDVSYIVDMENKVEFLLAATISVNKNQIFNDDNYEYESIGLPFLSNLGKVIYDYEKERKKEHLPDLDHLKF